MFDQKGGTVRLFLTIICILGLPSASIAAPVVQKIINDTDFGFLILDHSDNSECTLHDKFTIIQPHTIFNHEFLLEVASKGLILRPIFYKNKKEGKIFWLTDQNSYEYNNQLIENAYQNWFEKKSKKYTNSPEAWMKNWVGGDITVVYDPVEFLGYLLYLSRVRISNTNSYHTQLLSFAKGVFSKLMLEVRLSQKQGKGIAGVISVKHGQGGICNNGVIEQIV